MKMVTEIQRSVTCTSRLEPLMLTLHPESAGVGMAMEQIWGQSLWLWLRHPEQRCPGTPRLTHPLSTHPSVHPSDLQGSTFLPVYRSGGDLALVGDSGEEASVPAHCGGA